MKSTKKFNFKPLVCIVYEPAHVSFLCHFIYTRYMYYKKLDSLVVEFAIQPHQIAVKNILMVNPPANCPTLEVVYTAWQDIIVHSNI